MRFVLSTTRSICETPLGRMSVLGAFVAGLWMLLVLPAWSVGGVAGVNGLTMAAGLCLLPGWLVFLFSSGYGLPNFRLSVVLGGMVLRMLFVLAGTLGVVLTRRDLGLREFIVWLIVFYLATLAAETWIILNSRSQAK